jgi:SagB-type dehydrogenase family enzyme
LGRYLPDGEIEFRGRRDQQVKVHGHRIELGEIEAVLVQHEAVSQAAVVVREEAPGDKRLVAYVMGRDGVTPVVRALREHIQARLPAYMIPAAFVVLDALPLTPNGKIDRSAMPVGKVAASTAAGGKSVAPRSALEQSIAAIWRDVLALPEVSVQDNFFDLGGNSMLLVRMRTMLMDALHQDIAVATFFEFPTIATLVEHLNATQPDETYLRSGQARGKARKKFIIERAPAPQASHKTSIALPGAAATSVANAAEPTNASWVNAAHCPPPSITAPQERDAFRSRRLGLRPRAHQMSTIRLIDCPEFDHLSVMMRRSSARHFSKAQVSAESMGRLLSCLRCRPAGPAFKYRYASAGGLYPIQIYLATHDRHEGRVSMAPGIYYYNPLEHSLDLLCQGDALRASMHLPINQPVFYEAAFSLFIISEQQAIAPIYGSEGLRFALLEAGMVAQLLDEAAPRCGLGLCHIGGIDFEPYRHLFRLNGTHILLHGFLGGATVEPQGAGHLEVAPT